MDELDRMIFIGTSAGGVDALLQVIPQLPADFAAPIMVVLHVGGHRSHLPEMLSARSRLRAIFAQTGVAPQSGTVYFAPANRHLLLENGLLELTRGPKENHARPAIDPLFRSAALALGPRAVGVVLTGGLDDGSAGLRAIKACGGTTVVQDPKAAADPSMPLAALREAPADHVVRLDELAGLLAVLAQPLERAVDFTPPAWLLTEHAVSLGETTMQGLEHIGTPSPFSCPDCGGVLFEVDAGGVTRLRCHTGHAFSLAALAKMQDEVTEAAMWAAIRAVQEKEAILQRIAEVQRREAPGTEISTLAEARALRTVADSLRLVVDDAEDQP